MSDLKLAPGLTLPLDAATRRIAIMGGNDSGKTYCSTKLAELMLEQGVQIVALDPVGNWHGIRRDGKGKGFAIPVLGGLHGDIALDPGSGTLIADLVVDRGISVILDVSQFDSDAAQQRFAKDFMARLYNRRKAKPSAMCIFIEECHEFIPQSDFGDKQMLHVFNRAVKLGRNFGLGFCFISQRPQDVNKKSLERSQCVFAFQMQGRNERKAMVDWLGADTQINLNALLPKLPQGQPYCWSPGWLGIDRVVEKVFEKRSADVSKTPKVGEVSIASKPLTPIDLKALRDAMAKEVEEQKANDPKVLKARITELEKELQGKKPQPQVIPDERATARAIDAAVKDERARWMGKVDQLEAFRKQAREAARNAARSVQKFQELANGEEPDIPVPPPVQSREPERVSTPTPRAQSGAAVLNDELTRPQQAIIDALGEFESLAFAQPHRSQVAALAGASPKSSSYVNNLGRLRTLGYIIYPASARVALSEKGRGIVNASEPRCLSDYWDSWFTIVGESKAKILRYVISRRGEAIDKTELAQAVGASPISSSYVNNLGALRSFGLIDYPEKGFVAATDMLFPKGLK